MHQYFEQIFKQYYSPLCNYAYKFTGSGDIAEDIVQLLFVHLWETKKLNSVKNPERFLLSAVKFRCIDYLRTEKTKNGSLSDDIPDPVASYEINDITEADIEPMFHYFADKLPEKTREVFLLSRQSGLSYREIAEELSISVKTVENQMGRALRILRNLLKKENDPGIRLTLMFLL